MAMMTSRTIIRDAACAVVLGVFAGASAQGQEKPVAVDRAGSVLNCPDSDVLSQAPHGARRIGKHVLDVRWAGGTHRFKDEGLVDGEIGGVAWTYCGYDPVSHVHLIYKADGDHSLFTGVLLDDKTGALRPGGESVIMAPDQKFYFTYSQEDGMDGQVTDLYRRDGKKLGEGYSGMLKPDGSTIQLSDDNIRDLTWDDQDKLHATAYLDGGKTAPLDLILQAGGKIAWQFRK
jgi:hypothetical protein